LISHNNEEDSFGWALTLEKTNPRTNKNVKKYFIEKVSS
jgi:hypothetical protein